MSQQTMVITGCSSGFGRCTALEMARRDWLVFATVRKEADRASLLQEAEQHHCQQNLIVLLCDITQTDEVTALVCEVDRQLRRQDQGVVTPRLDALLNNAGTAYASPIEMVPLDDLRAQFEINVIAHVGMIQAFLPMLKTAKGTVINLSSVSGRLVTPVLGPYAASKFALEAISDALRMELKPFGVRVVVIEPASSPTSIWRTSLERSLARLGGTIESSPYARLLQDTLRYAKSYDTKGFPPQQVADLVVKILAQTRPYARYGVPGYVAVYMALHRLLPSAVWDRLIHFIIRS